MKKSHSLKGRKFNVIIPKTSNNIANPEKTENKNTSKILIKTLAELPDLYLPIKKIPHAHNTNKKQKNKMNNQIPLEKLKYIIMNLRMSKNEQNKNEKQKNKNTALMSENNCFKSNLNLYNKNEITKNQNNDDVFNSNANDLDLKIKFNSDNNLKLNNVSELIINRSNSLETEINPNFEILQFRNKEKEKKWYNNIEFLTEKYNELILTTESLEKNILNKYLDGTDNIISEIEEPQYLKEDIDINTLKANVSLRKHLSIRETTLDSSYQNSLYHTDKLKGKAKGFILRIKNYRKIFRKYRTNFTIKSIKENIDKNKVKYNNEYNKENHNLKNRKKNENKRKKKLPIFSKSLSKINNQNNINSINIDNSNNECSNLNKRNVSFDKEYKNAFFSLNEIKKRYRNSSSFCKYDENNLNKNDIEKRNPSLAIIKETNDNININNELNENYKYRKQSAKIVYDISKTKVKNKLRENTPKEKNKYSSEKYLNNYYKTKNYFDKKKYYINSGYKLFINDEFFKNLKSDKSFIDEYIISSDLGIGSYAQVKLGIHKITKKKYAIKIYDKNLIDDEEKKNSIKNEIFILKQLNNENIMKLYDVINTNRHLYLFLEYINGISLLEYIQKSENKRIEEKICKKIFYQIVKAISYCQNKNICHRDIKLENILIINDNNIKLIDFGFAIKCNRNDFQEFFCGTLYYMPPEIVNKQKYIPFYSDIWSLGVLLYTMLYGKFPFKSKKEEELFELINKAKLVFPTNVNISDEAKKLLMKIIVIKPSKRLSLENILNDPWFIK